MLPSKQRVPRSLFLKVWGKAKNISGPHITLKFLNIKTNSKESRFSFVVSSKVSKKATTRNLLRRRGYYIIKKYKNNILDYSVCLFFFKKGANKLSFKELEEEIITLLKRAIIYKNS